jgi:uncharacterized protein involved in propanediol utilization
MPISASDEKPVHRSAVGHCITHHGELLQGALRIGGAVTPCLVTLPRRDRISTCRLQQFEADRLEVIPAWKSKALRAVRIVFERCGEARATGRMTMMSEVGTGLGLGSSTADVVAAIRASAALVGTDLLADEVASIAVEAEAASDPLMFGRFALLFAQRIGRILEDWGEWYPEYVVFSGRLAPAGKEIDTLRLPPRTYSEADLDLFAALVETLRGGFRRRDPATIAAAATHSAVLNQNYVPLERFDAMHALAEDMGALGVQIAHSGIVGGVLFDPGDAALGAKVAALATAWLRLDAGPFELFDTSASSGWHDDGGWKTSRRFDL